MKKICIVNFNIYCLFNPRSDAPMGGGELDMFTIAKGLESDYEISVLTGDWGQKNIENYSTIKVYKSVKLGDSNYIRSLFIFWKKLKEINADVYLSTGAGPEVGIISFFCKLKNKKFIYRTAHAIDCDGSYVKNNGIYGLMYSYGLMHADYIVTSVQQHRELLAMQNHFLRNRVSHINLGIVSQDITIAKNYILWVARCEKWKRPDIFLDIVFVMPSVNFVMICPKQKNNAIYFEEIRRRAESLPNITFIDFVPFSDIQPYFDKAKVFINTSDSEGFTYTLIQSGIGKTPVMYLNVNPDNVITKYNIGYVSEGSTEKMLSKIKELMSNEEEWKQKSENAYKYVRENHDILIVGKQWRDLICILLKS